MRTKGNGAHGAAAGAAELTEQGRAIHRAGKLDDAERLYWQALTLDGDYAEAHHLLAVLAGQRGRFDESIAGFKRAIELAGPSPERCCNLAEAHRLAGDFAAALDAYNQAISLDGDYLDAYRDCADAAKAEAEQALTAMHGDAAARFNRLAAHYLDGLARALVRKKDFRAAQAALEEACALDPTDAELANHHGMTLLSLSGTVSAEEKFRRAIALKPGTARFHDGLGVALRQQLRLDEARAEFEAALRLDPNFIEARRNLDERALMPLHYLETLSGAEIDATHRAWGARAMAQSAAPLAPSHAERDPERRLRIGYVSPDLRMHAVISFLEPLLGAHDPAQVEVYCYAEVESPDAVTERLKALVQGWRSTVGVADDDVANMVRRDEIDVLIDLAGHSANNRLGVFALKPAPLAVTWLGYPGITGLPAIDYRLTDAVADPLDGAESDPAFGELLYRLPDGFLCYAPAIAAPDVSPLPMRRRGGVTFGCFNNPMKIAPAAIAAWSRILGRLPDARLVLKGLQFRDAKLAAQFQGRFAAAGVEPGRVEILPPTEALADHLSVYGEIDIGLDPFPYNGTTTSCEAFWMGVPVVALRGTRHAARVGASLLTQVGLGDLIAESVDDYVAKAVALAQDSARLAAIRLSLRDRLKGSPLGDAAGFARRFEAALRAMWRRWCAEAGAAAPAGSDSAAGPSVQQLEARAQALLKAKQYKDAEIAFREVLARDGDRPDAFAGAAEAARREAGEAAAAGHSELAQQLNRLAGIYFEGLGQLHWRRRAFDRAEAAFREGLAVDRDNARLLNNLGALLHAQGRLQEAEETLRRAIAIDPSYAESHNNLGTVLADRGEYEAGEAALKEALALNPSLPAALANFSHSRLMNLNYRPEISPAALFEAHRDWGREFLATRSAPGTAAPAPLLNRPDPERPLRIGYISPDFREHSVAYFFEPLLAAHDRRAYPAICYADVPVPDATTRRLMALADGWRPITGMSDEEVQNSIRADGIDVLVELAGHTVRTRLTALAPKPAPVTVTWLGYPATTGLPSVDYRITDAVADPPGESDRLHTEKLVRLPQGFLCYRADPEAPAAAPPPSTGRGYVTFGSFNNPAKLNPATLGVWARILRAVPGSRLILKGRFLADPGIRRRWQEELARDGIGPERYDFRAQTTTSAAHLAMYGEIDIALDPYPYNGTTTSCEAMWMGVPVVALRGERHAARVGASLLTQLGLEELIAESEADYIAKAAELAGDATRLARLRAELRGRIKSSPLGDEQGFARRFETALRAMWRQWCAGA